MSPKIKRHSSFEGHPGCRTTWRRAAASRVPSVRQAPLLAHVGVRAHAPAFPAPVPQQAAEMLMPKKNRVAIYELLFKEGVMVAKKDVHLAKHPELADKNVPNLHVMKAMQHSMGRGQHGLPGGRLTGTHTGAQRHRPVPIRRPKPALEPRQTSSLEVDLAVDEDSSLSNFPLFLHNKALCLSAVACVLHLFLSQTMGVLKGTVGLRALTLQFTPIFKKHINTPGRCKGTDSFMGSVHCQKPVLM
uniref:Ribosomal protein S10 n=1 Tax=Paramormyrops kingsleyae TaxID=1676925 RepID=A0A3B3R9T1_9TELE